MSIQTELTRITNAKAAIKTAIEGKGVTVPDGTLLDGMAALIEAIQAGGGGDVGFYTGTFIPESTTQRVNLFVPVYLKDTSVLPTFGLYVVYRKATEAITNTRIFEALISCLYVNSSGSLVARSYFYGYASNKSQIYTPYYKAIRVKYGTSNDSSTQFTDKGLKIGNFTTFAGVEFAAGYEYEWFATGDGITG